MRLPPKRLDTSRLSIQVAPKALEADHVFVRGRLHARNELLHCELQIVPVLSQVRASHREASESAYCFALKLTIVVKIPLHNWTGHLLCTGTQRLTDELGMSWICLVLWVLALRPPDVTIEYSALS